LPSFYIASDKAWSVWRAGACGAAVGLVASALKALVPLHAVIAATWHPRAGLLANAPEIAAATLGFALLCAAAAALRNLLAKRLIWRQRG
jgi:hypothetical protein